MIESCLDCLHVTLSHSVGNNFYLFLSRKTFRWRALHCRRHTHCSKATRMTAHLTSNAKPRIAFHQNDELYVFIIFVMHALRGGGGGTFIPNSNFFLRGSFAGHEKRRKTSSEFNLAVIWEQNFYDGWRRRDRHYRINHEVDVLVVRQNDEQEKLTNNKKKKTHGSAQKPKRNRKILDEPTTEGECLFVAS